MMANAAATPLPESRGHTPLQIPYEQTQAFNKTSFNETQGLPITAVKEERRDTHHTSREPSIKTAAIVQDHLKLSQHVRDSSGSSPEALIDTHAETSADRKHMSAEHAAAVALCDHRPVEIKIPDVSKSAERAASIAVREHKSPKPLGPELSISHTGVPEFEPIHTHITNTEDVVRSERTKTLILRAASLSVSESREKVPIRASDLAPGEVIADQGRRKRSLNAPHLEQAARNAAARRLALLDKELSGAGCLRRLVPPDDGEDITHTSSNLPRRSATVSAGVSSRGGYASVMEIARRNVGHKLASIDRQVAEKHGRVYQEDWNERALRVAEARNAAKRAESNGKIDVGGGKLVDANVIDDIAARNVKPVLEDISANAEARRAKEAQERWENEQRKRHEELVKARERDMRRETKRERAKDKEGIALRKEEKRGKRRIQGENKLSLSHIFRDPDDTAAVAKAKEGPPQTTADMGTRNKETKTGTLRRLFERLRRGSPPSQRATDVEGRTAQIKGALRTTQPTKAITEPGKPSTGPTEPSTSQPESTPAPPIFPGPEIIPVDSRRETDNASVTSPDEVEPGNRDAEVTNRADEGVSAKSVYSVAVAIGEDVIVVPHEATPAPPSVTTSIPPVKLAPVVLSAPAVSVDQAATTGTEAEATRGEDIRSMERRNVDMESKFKEVL